MFFNAKPKMEDDQIEKIHGSWFDFAHHAHRVRNSIIPGNIQKATYARRLQTHDWGVRGCTSQGGSEADNAADGEFLDVPYRLSLSRLI